MVWITLISSVSVSISIDLFRNLKKILRGCKYTMYEYKLGCLLQKPHGMVYVTEILFFYNLRVITRKRALQRFSKTRNNAFQ